MKIGPSSGSLETSKGALVNDVKKNIQAGFEKLVSQAATPAKKNSTPDLWSARLDDLAGQLKKGGLSDDKVVAEFVDLALNTQGFEKAPGSINAAKRQITEFLQNDSNFVQSLKTNLSKIGSG